MALGCLSCAAWQCGLHAVCGPPSDSAQTNVRGAGQEFEGRFRFRGSWRRTYLASHAPAKHAQPPKAPPRPPRPPLRVARLYSDLLHKPHWLATRALDAAWLARDTLPRAAGLSAAEFRVRFEEPNVPVVITDIVSRPPPQQDGRLPVPWLRPGCAETGLSRETGRGLTGAQWAAACRRAEQCRTSRRHCGGHFHSITWAPEHLSTSLGQRTSLPR